MDRRWAGLSAVLRLPRSADDEVLLASLTPEEWSDLVDMAIRQGVASQVLSTELPPLPDEAAARLRQRAEWAADRTGGFRQDLLELAAAVAPGIRIVVLKGMHLSLDVYPPSVVREMADLDVLVSRDQVTLVAEAAKRLGFAHDPEAMERVPHHLPPLIKADRSIEVHWRLTEPGEPPTAEVDELWPRLRPLPVAGNIFSLGPEEAVIHVCAHAAYSHHFEQGMRPLCDLRALIARHGDSMDWSLLAARAHKWNSARGVVLALCLARDLLGVAIPESALNELGGAPPATVSEAGLSQVFSRRTAMTSASGSAGRLLAGSPWQRLRFIFRALRLPREQIAVLYPGRSPNSLPLVAWVMARRLVSLSQRYGGLMLQAAVQPDSPEGRHIAQRNMLRGWLTASNDSA